MDARFFLSTRTPPVPEGLDRWLSQTPLDGVPPLDGLCQQGLLALDDARREPGRIRDSAFHLLAADALLTYACEAALEADDPAMAFEAILAQAAEAR